MNWKARLTLILIVVCLGVIGCMAIYLWPYRETISQYALKVLFVFAVLAVLTIGTGTLILIFKLLGLLAKGIHACAHGVLSIVEKRQELRHADERHRIALRGTWLEQETLVIKGGESLFTRGVQHQIQPHHIAAIHSSEHHNKDNHLALPSPTDVRNKPTVEEMIALVTPNSLDIALGRSQAGEPIRASLKGTHIKLIGGSQMGKSCQAGAILTQLSNTHDPSRLKFAILDLEDKTGRLFEDDPHILDLKMDGQKIHMHARSVAEVARQIIILHAYMNYRYALPAKTLKQLPIILIYFEEFLYWKRTLNNFVDEDTREDALTAFSGIATRGLKAGIHIMACAQVDYRDSELVEAMAQFIGVNMSFCVKPKAAQAAGFTSFELLSQNYAAKKRGQFVIEQIGSADIGIAPDFDVSAKLEQLEEHEDDEQEEPEETWNNVVDATFRELPNRVPRYQALPSAFHNQPEKLRGDLLTVYRAHISLNKSTNCRQIEEKTGISKTKVNELINKLKELGYIKK